MKWWIYPLIGLSMAISFAGIGARLTESRYEKEIAQMRADYEARAKAQALANQKEAEENAKKLAEAISERDEALANATALSADASRVREQASAFSLRMPSGSTNSYESCQQKLAESVRLLSEGSGLLAEGAELLNRVAADKDALVKLR